MAKLKPLGDRVLVRPLQQQEMTKSGIVLPESSKEKPQEGEVLAVGAGKYIDGKLQPLDVQVGQKVLFSKYAPNDVKIDGEELYIMSEGDILGILE